MKKIIVVLLLFLSFNSFSQACFYNKATNKYGVINNEGEIIYNPKSERRIDYLNGYARIVEDKKFGLIDSLGNIIIKPQYDFMYDYSEGLLGVQKNGQFGFVNLKNETIIDFNFDEACIFCDSIAWIQQGSVYGFINIKGEEITPTIYDKVYPSFNDTAYASRNGVRYYISTEGVFSKDNEQITHPFGFMKTTYSCPKYLISKNQITHKYDKEQKLMTYFDSDKNPIFSMEMHRAYPFQNGFTFYESKQGSGFGILDDKGSIIVKPNKQWIWVYDGGFNNGIALIESEKENKEVEFIYVNEQGKVIFRGDRFTPKSEDSY